MSKVGWTKEIEEMDFSDAAKDTRPPQETEEEITDHILSIFALANEVRGFAASKGADSLTGIQAFLAAVAMQSAYVADVQGVDTAQSTDAVVNIYKRLVVVAKKLIAKQKEENAKAKEKTAGKSLVELAKRMK